MLTITRSELLTKSFGQNMFPRFLIFLWLVRIQKSVISISRGILNETWVNIPYNMIPTSPFLLLLQHKPSQENNKQMSRMGTAPSKSSQALRQASFSVLVPRVEGKGHASAWQSQWLSRTRKTWQKLPLSVSFIHSFKFYTPTCTSLYTQSKELRVKQ